MIDWPIMLMVAGIGVALTIILGLVPLIQFRGLSIHNVLRDGAAGITSGGRQQRMRAVLVSAEISLVMFLVIATGVLIRGYGNVARIAWGYDFASDVSCVRGENQQEQFGSGA